jgi:hypothetical protein
MAGLTPPLTFIRYGFIEPLVQTLVTGIHSGRIMPTMMPPAYHSDPSRQEIEKYLYLISDSA